MYKGYSNINKDNFSLAEINFLHPRLEKRLALDLAEGFLIFCVMFRWFSLAQ